MTALAWSPWKEAGLSEKFLYLAYGSNLHPARLKKRAPSAIVVDSAVELAGWALRFDKRSNDGSAKTAIAHTGNDNDYVRGVIFKLEQCDRKKLDKAEGLGKGYDEKWLSFDGHGRVLTYVASNSHIDDKLQPYFWYRDFVLEGMRFHGFPEEYVRQVLDVPCERDPDDARRLKNEALLKELEETGPWEGLLQVGRTD